MRLLLLQEFLARVPAPSFQYRGDTGLKACLHAQYLFLSAIDEPGARGDRRGQVYGIQKRILGEIQ
jgi:hypothetical protein